MKQNFFMELAAILLASVLFQAVLVQAIAETEKESQQSGVSESQDVSDFFRVGKLQEIYPWPEPDDIRIWRVNESQSHFFLDFGTSAFSQHVDASFLEGALGITTYQGAVPPAVQGYEYAQRLSQYISQNNIEWGGISLINVPKLEEVDREPVIRHETIHTELRNNQEFLETINSYYEQLPFEIKTDLATAFQFSPDEPFVNGDVAPESINLGPEEAIVQVLEGGTNPDGRATKNGVNALSPETKKALDEDVRSGKLKYPFDDLKTGFSSEEKPKETKNTKAEYRPIDAVEKGIPFIQKESVAFPKQYPFPGTGPVAEKKTVEPKKQTQNEQEESFPQQQPRQVSCETITSCLSQIFGFPGS